MATFRQRGRRWQALIKRDGKQTSKTFARKSEAVAWAASIESGATDSGRTLREALERYRDTVSSEKRGERWERMRIESFLREWGAVDLRLAQVGRAEITEWRDARLREVAPATVRREMTLLSHVFRLACNEWGWSHSIPTATVARPRNSAPRTRVFSDAEVDRICLALGYESGPPQSTSQQTAVAFLIALETAMRSGEVLGMRWEHLHPRVIHIPKTKTDMPRDVPLSKRARELIDWCRGLDDDRIIPVSGPSRDALFRRAMRRAGVEGATFHDARRTATSRLAKIFDLMELARITGHKDLRLLHSTYYSVDVDDLASRLG